MQRSPEVEARDPGGKIDWAQVGSLSLVMAAVWLLWPTWVVYPLKILVVFFHEASHGLAAVVTGGRIESIEVVAREGGLARTAGGSRFLILTAGYLGSLVCGGVILLLAARTRFDRQVTAILGALLLLGALVWVRPILSFGFAFALLAGVALALAGLYLPNRINDDLLKAIGLTSVLYAVFDIQDDILARPHLLESDAAVLGRLTHLPTLFWGLVWMAAAIGAGIFFLTLACRKQPT